MTTFPKERLGLASRLSGETGAPTLAQELLSCVTLWHAGKRDRELCLHLLFLAWYCNLEPPHLTGVQREVFPDDNLGQLFFEVFQTVEEGIKDDPECLYVIGLMASLTPYLLGDTEQKWTARAESYRSRYRQLHPAGLDPELFKNRGAYGEYFGSQVAVPGGF